MRLLMTMILGRSSNRCHDKTVSLLNMKHSLLLHRHRLYLLSFLYLLPFQGAVSKTTHSKH